ncbi:MAG: ElyC/SanA/YdcF family protein [Clostridiaceae bacterium]|nr:ElyC/SanA/YdcF family protein [Clostridiaceae bacterium]
MQNTSFFQKFWKIALILAAAGILLFAGINLFMILYSGRYILTPEEAAQKDVDCALVLGAQVWSTGLSPMLEDRVLTGIALYESGATDRLLMSGDHGREDYDEVNQMKRYAVEKGVPADDIFMDHAGFSTYESAYRAKAVFEVKSAFLVTQKYHLYRAVFLARMMGIEAYGVAADRRDYRNDFYNNTRESLARVKDLFMAIFRPEPTYLGDTIPIWGSGSLTDDSDDYTEAGGNLHE